MTDLRDELRSVARTLRRLADWDREDGLIGYPSDSPERLAALMAQIPRRQVDEPLPSDAANTGTDTLESPAAAPTFILSEGPATAALVFVGVSEHPHDAAAHPFAGAAGELLEKMIGAMGLRRQDVVLVTVLAGPPGDAPTEAELGAALPEALAAISPRVIVAVHDLAVRTLAGPTASLQGMRGQLTPLALPNGQPFELMATLPPAHLLGSPGDKRGVWEDLRRVMGALGLPGGIPRGTAP